MAKVMMELNMYSGPFSKCIYLNIIKNLQDHFVFVAQPTNVVIFLVEFIVESD